MYEYHVTHVFWAVSGVEFIGDEHIVILLQMKVKRSTYKVRSKA